jgi:hypothetical protein
VICAVRSVTYEWHSGVAPYVRLSGKPFDVMTRNNEVAPHVANHSLSHPASAVSGGAGQSRHGLLRPHVPARQRASSLAGGAPDSDRPGAARQELSSFWDSLYEAVTARQATSACQDGIDRRRDLTLLDSEIEAFNNLIAAQCGG